MVIQFSVSNFRSIFHTQTLNFRATNLVSENKEVDKVNLVELGENRVLKAVGIYGANASGKSNIVKAIGFFRNMVTHSLTNDRISKLGMNPFRLSTDVMDHSGFFEMVLLIGDKKYRYGFSLTIDAEIAAEWLHGPAEKNETFYFTRKGDKITFNPLWFQEADDLPKEKLRKNALFLSFCASYDGTISTSIKDYISDKISIDPNSRRMPRPANSVFNTMTDHLIEEGNKKIVLTWLKEAGLSFSDVNLQKFEVSGKNYGNFVVLNKHLYNEKGEIQGYSTMNLEEDESDGTRKFYSYIGTLHQKFQEGGLFVSDEIDSNFHPALLRKLVCYFNNPSINKAHAQVVFTSHDTNLMSPTLMRRDQFYFTEKSLLEESILYSLSDLKGIRNNADFASQYLAGLYGALPQLGNYLEEKSTSL